MSTDNPLFNKGFFKNRIGFPIKNSLINSTEQSTGLRIKQQFNVNFMSGLFTGVFCAALFNPWDRALFLSLLHKRDFLLRDNFKSPYQGVLQAMMQRALIGGIYYILQAELNYYLSPYLRTHFEWNEVVIKLWVGLLSGAINGLLMNSTSAIKYYTWSQDKYSFFKSAAEMKSLGGINRFFTGTLATMGRDAVFGMVYEMGRYLLNPVSQEQENESSLRFICNLTAASMATISSSPLNYARNFQYATLAGIPPLAVKDILKHLWMETMQFDKNPYSRIRFLRKELQIGWGATRVAVSMAAGQQVFDLARSKLS